jgi:hypothetical protein
MICLFCLGLHIVTTEKGIAKAILYSDCSFIGYFLSGVSFCDIRERAYIFDYDTKEKEHQNTWQSDQYSGA